MAGSAGAVRAMAKCIQPVPGLDKSWSMGKYPHSPDRAGLSGRNNANAGQHYNQSPPARQWGKKGGYHEETGRSRGGLTTKVHAVTDGLGNPLRFLLSSGNRNDICMAQALLEPFDLNGKLILADKGYDSDKFVRWLEERGGIAVIPSRIIAKHPRKTDWHTYKERHLVENLFLKLKNNRRFATRYEKKALYFRAVVCLVCILVWLL